MSNATKSAPFYRLGTIQNGRTFYFVDLGEFKSGLAARECWLAQPRNGTAYVFEMREVRRHGVAYGLEETIVATV